MSTELDRVCRSALQFFGTVTASISHEINNVLAIVNENAGLLEDFTAMSEKGIPIDEERLKTLAGKITAQVRRADAIVRNMNKFAHSVDEFTKRIDLNELLDLVLALANRSASMRGVNLELKFSGNPVFITTNDFFLANLLWLCMHFAMDAVDENNTVAMHVEKSDNFVMIYFSRLKNVEEMITSLVDHRNGLLGALKGELNSDTEAGEVVLTLPENINP